MNAAPGMIDAQYGCWRVLGFLDRTSKRAFCKCIRCGRVAELGVNSLRSGEATCDCRPMSRTAINSRRQRERAERLRHDWRPKR